MQSIIVNDTKIEIKSSFSRLNELVKDVSMLSLNSNKILLSVEVDGRNIDLEENLDRFELKDDSSIYLVFHDSKQLLLNSINSIPSYTNLILEKIDMAHDEILSIDIGHNQSTQFSELISLLNLFVELMTKVQSNIKLLYNHSKSQDIHKLEIELLGIMKGILAARESDDQITLCDLLKYELRENILQWKINSTNILKKQLKDSA